VFQIIRHLNDPEHPLTLEQLNVVSVSSLVLSCFCLCLVFVFTLSFVWSYCVVSCLDLVCSYLVLSLSGRCPS
jgi:hypothetical protein